MSMHTYIGARYVPNFIGTYDPTQAYEAMDVIDNGSGTSYIAKVPTPPGTPLTDTDHWFLYGASSGAIVNLQNQINQINSDLVIIDHYVSPKKYGAAGDGVTDDTQAIQDCIDANDRVIIDADYLITNTITLHSGLHIIGNGTIKNVTENLTSLFGDTVTNVVVEGIKFENGSVTSTSTIGINGNIYFSNSTDIIVRGIYDINCNKYWSIIFDKCQRFSVSECEIINSGYAGIGCYGNCHNGIITNNYVKVSTYTGFNNTYGIGVSCYDLNNGPDKAYECTYIMIDSNIVECDLGHWEGIDSHAGDHLVVSNNLVKGFAVGIRLTRHNSYTDLNGGPTHSSILNNQVVGSTNMNPVRDAMIGIAINGNQAQINHCVIAGNVIDTMNGLYAGNDIGFGVEIQGNAISVNNNEFKNRIFECIRITGAGASQIIGNNANIAQGNFLRLDGITDTIVISENYFQNGYNFYDIQNTTGLGYIVRNDNKIANARWKDNTADVTNVTDFVPDYVNVDPSSSSYHPKGMIALKSSPASGSPMGWVSNGSTWLAMANLT